jgi:dihydrofolate reductase
VEAEGTDVDTYFPNLDKLPNWVVESTSEPVEDNGYTYRFVVYRNTNLD